MYILYLFGNFYVFAAINIWHQKLYHAHFTLFQYRQWVELVYTDKYW